MIADPMDVYNLAKKYAKNYVGKGIDYEDLVQTAMVGAIKACAKFNPTLGALTTISVYCMRDELNKACFSQSRKGRQQRYTEIQLDNEFLIADDTQEPSKIYESQQFNILIKKAASKLTERELTAFNDYYYNDSYDTYCKEYDTTHSQAQKRAGAAKLKLTKYLKDLIK